jgi:stage II sporulation protein AB (anti-sigma F factor)
MDGWIYITVSLLDGRVAKIEIKDRGCGIEDVKQARMPLFTTDAASERSGMGFTVMESFTDKLTVSSRLEGGTKIVMYKVFKDRDT